MCESIHWHDPEVVAKTPMVSVEARKRGQRREDSGGAPSRECEARARSARVVTGSSLTTAERVKVPGAGGPDTNCMGAGSRIRYLLGLRLRCRQAGIDGLRSYHRVAEERQGHEKGQVT